MKTSREHIAYSITHSMRSVCNFFEW